MLIDAREDNTLHIKLTDEEMTHFEIVVVSLNSPAISNVAELFAYLIKYISSHYHETVKQSDHFKVDVVNASDSPVYSFEKNGRIGGS